MVKFKILTATLTLLGGFLLAACDTENVTDTYTPTNQNTSFEQKQLPQALSTSADFVYEVKLLRVKSDGAYTAHYTLKSETAANFVDETQGSVNFENGQNVATIKVKATAMEVGKTYKAILALAESEKAQRDPAISSIVDTTSISIKCDYEWEKAGRVSFTDFTFSDDGATDTVFVEHGKGSNVYRLVEPYSVYRTNGAKGTDIEFKLDENHAASKDAGLFPLETTNALGYKMYWDPAKYPTHCTLTSEGNVYTFTFLAAKGGKLYPGGKFTFKWFEGWPGQ